MKKNLLILTGVLAFSVLFSACSIKSTSNDANSTQLLSSNDKSNSEKEEYYTFELNEEVERQHVSYKNRYGINLAADLYTPKNIDTTKEYSALVVGPPYGGIKEQGPGVYANELAQRGFVVLAFDPSYNGESEGEPRHVSSPDIFVEDFSAGIDYLGSLDYVNRDKIGVIGICGSGGFSLSAAQIDTRIKAVVTASLVDISSNTDSMTPEERTALLNQIGEQRWKDFENETPEYIPSFPKETASEIPKDLDPMSAEFYSYYGLKRGHHPNATGNFTTTSQASFMNFNLLDHLDMISPRPVMMIAGENALTRGLTEEVYSKLKNTDRNELYIVPDANHVDLYDDITKIPFDKIENFFNEKL